ncbi:MAG: DNA polymerase III subunit gamma/tau [Chlamydiia bacterium]|nr:DNA polymerase III subunit gamma/tau [Chlamydiia bacterium]
MSKYQILARRYRPQKFVEVVGQEAAVTTLKNAIRLSQVAHGYLFCGSRGVGKTTLARLFAKALNCPEKGTDCEPCGRCASCQEIAFGQSLDVIEIDGASNRGIDDIRQINETVGYAPSSGQYKIYIIDEVHMLTKEAFNALLKTLEEPPEKAKFFFATTEPHKVPSTILSRCQRFDLHRLSIPQMTAKLDQIARELNRAIEPEALYLIASFADGSLRDAESLLDQIFCFSQESQVSGNTVRQMLGLMPQESLFALDRAFSELKTAYAFELVAQLYQTGKDMAHFFEQLIEHYRIIALCKTLGEKALPSEIAARYQQATGLYTASQTLYILDYLLQGEARFSSSLSPRIFLEAALLHIIRSKNRIPVEVLVKKLTELEEALLASDAQGIEPAREPKPTTLQPPIEEPDPEPAPEPDPIGIPPPTLKPVPFRPQATLAAPKPEPAPPPPAPIAPLATPTPAFVEADAKHPSHYDTLMRFAAVELEGNLRRE